MHKKVFVTLAVVAVILALGLTAHFFDFAGMVARVHGG
jgi:hypothetical protein